MLFFAASPVGAFPLAAGVANDLVIRFIRLLPEPITRHNKKAADIKVLSLAAPCQFQANFFTDLTDNEDIINEVRVLRCKRNEIKKRKKADRLIDHLALGAFFG